MTDRQRFRFGIQASSAPDRRTWVDLAKKVEDGGFAVLSIPDHFDDQLAPVPALMTAADATSHLRIGALVWDNDFKHPVVLAKELATMDLLSDGRLEIGVGAGWELSDYEKSGIRFDQAKVRVDRFIEGVGVIKAHLGPDPFSFAGEHYNVTNLNGMPKPVQTPRPPILIGGGGKRMLSFAAREADIVGVNPTLTAGFVGDEVFASMSAEAVDAKIAIVREAAGTRLSEIELNCRSYVVRITDNAKEATASLAGALNVSEKFLQASPFALIGPPSKLVENLLERRERWGFSYVIVDPDDIDDFAPVVGALAGK